MTQYQFICCDTNHVDSKRAHNVCLHQLMAEQQDEQLELVSGTIGVLKNMSERIGMELDEQSV